MVEADLAKAEPALIAAKKNVESISNSELSQMKTVNKPTPNVLMTMRAIYYMLNKESKFLPRPGANPVEWP